MTSKNFLLSLVGLLLINFVSAQKTILVDSNLWKPNGPILALKTHGDTLFIGGEFQTVGPEKPYAATFDNQGKVLTAFPSANNIVDQAISDGNKGFYISGSFTKIGSENRGGIAHIDSNGVVTPFFSNKSLNGSISTLTLKDSILYAGGFIRGVEETTGGGAVLNLSNMYPDLSFPKIEGSVYASIPDGKGGIFIGGDFTKIGNYKRRNLAHIDVNGKVTAWGPETDGTVWALAKSDEYIFAGGSFTLVEGRSRNKFAAFKNYSITPNDWNINGGIANVFSLLVHGGKVYIGTGFGFSGKGPSNVYALNLSNGSLAFTTPTIPGNIHAMAAYKSYIYIGGNFDNPSAYYQKVAGVDTSYGSVAGWSTANNNVLGDVYALAMKGDTLLVGGSFAGGNGLVGLPLSSFSIVSSLSIPGNVYSILLKNDSTLLLGGEFYTGSWFDNNLKNIVELNINSKVYTIKNVSSNSMKISTISLLGNSKLFCGGNFHCIALEKHSNILAINTKNSTVLPWAPKVNGLVNSIEVSDTNVYIGGEFYEVNSHPRRYIAKLSTLTDSISGWQTPMPNGFVRTMLLKGDTLFVGGEFKNIGASNINCLAAIDINSGNPLSWNANINGSSVVSLTLNGNSLFICGSFTQVNSASRLRIASINAHTATVNTFNANLTSSYSATKSIIWKNYVMFMGFFSATFPKPTKYFALYDLSTGIENTSIDFNASNNPLTIAASGDRFFVGGRFSSIGGKVRNNIAAINLITGKVTDWNPDVNNKVFSLDIVDRKVYIGGDFTTVKGQTRNKGAALSIDTDQLHTWNPNTNAAITQVLCHKGHIFIGGSFSTVRGQNRFVFAQTDSATGQPTSFSPLVSSSTINLSNITSIGDSVYVSGRFSSFSGNNRQNLAGFNSNSLTTTGLNLSFSDSLLNLPVFFRVIPVNNVLLLSGRITKVDTLKTRGNALYDFTNNTLVPWIAPSIEMSYGVGYANNNMYYSGSFPNNNNRYRYGTIAINNLTKEFSPWYIKNNSTICDVVSYKNKLYIGGSFTQINEGLSLYLAGVRTHAIGFEKFESYEYCLGSDMKIKISTSGAFDTSNKFVLLMSDSTGNYKNGFVLDTISSASDSFAYKIPINFPVANNYLIKVVSTSPAMDGIDEMAINILPKPKADFTINDEYQCLSSNLFTLKDSSNITGSVFWSFGDSTNDSGSRANKHYTKEGSYNVKMLLTPSIKVCPKDSIIKIVEVLPQPKPDFTINDSIQCNHNDSFAFNNTSTINKGTMTYYWNFGNSLSSIDSNTYSSYVDTGFYSVVLYATSDSGCVDSNKHNVLVIQKPSAQFSINDTLQCLRNNLFNFNFTGHNSHYYKLSWKFSNGDTSSQKTLSKSFTIDSLYTVRLMIYEDSTCLDSSSKNVWVASHPISQFTVDSMNRCENDVISFINSTSIKSGSVVSYSWDFDDGFYSTSINPSHVYNNSNNYTIKLVSASNDGCYDTLLKTISIFKKPVADFVINDTVQCFKSQIFLFTDKSSITAPDSLVSYEWLLGDGNSSTVKNPTHTYTDTGYYFVLEKVTSDKGCSDTAQLIAIVAPEPVIDTIFGPISVKSGDTSVYSIVNDTFTTYFWSVDYGSLYIGVDSSYAEIIWDSVTATSNALIKIFPINIAGCFGDTAYLTVTIDTSSTPLLIEELAINEISIYPNPAKSIVMFNKNVNASIIYDGNGRSVLKTTVNHSKIDVSSLKNGTYTLLLFIGKSAIPFKLQIVNN